MPVRTQAPGKRGNAMGTMSRKEIKLVEEHLYLVRNIVLGCMTLNESIQGLGYDDLYQTGCEALCHAAQNYREDGGAAFATFANTAVRNYLLSHCRRVMRIQKPLKYLEEPVEDGSRLTYADSLADEGWHALSDADIFLILSDAESRYSGICRKGIKALQMKCMGHTRKEIAACYGVKPNHVSAWISRAASRLRAENCLALQ